MMLTFGHFLGWGGGLSDFVVVPEYCVIKVPDNVPLDVAGECSVSYRKDLKAPDQI